MFFLLCYFVITILLLFINYLLLLMVIIIILFIMLLGNTMQCASQIVYVTYVKFKVVQPNYAPRNILHARNMYMQISYTLLSLNELMS